MDLEQVHELHRKVMSDIIKSPIFTDEQKQNFYEFYVELNKHPEKDWNKKDTIEKISKIK